MASSLASIRHSRIFVGQSELQDALRIDSSSANDRQSVANSRSPAAGPEGRMKAARFAQSSFRDNFGTIEERKFR